MLRKDPQLLAPCKFFVLLSLPPILIHKFGLPFSIDTVTQSVTYTTIHKLKHTHNELLQTHFKTNSIHSNNFMYTRNPTTSKHIHQSVLIGSESDKRVRLV